jgi:hypothetical protein
MVLLIMRAELLLIHCDAVRGIFLNYISVDGDCSSPGHQDSSRATANRRKVSYRNSVPSDIDGSAVCIGAVDRSRFLAVQRDVLDLFTYDYVSLHVPLTKRTSPRDKRPIASVIVP